MARKRKVKVVTEPIVEPEEPVVTVAPTPEPTKQEQIDELLKNHPDFLGTPTARYYGEVLYPWLHELEQLLE